MNHLSRKIIVLSSRISNFGFMHSKFEQCRFGVNNCESILYGACKIGNVFKFASIVNNNENYGVYSNEHTYGDWDNKHDTGNNNNEYFGKIWLYAGGSGLSVTKNKNSNENEDNNKDDVDMVTAKLNLESNKVGSNQNSNENEDNNKDDIDMDIRKSDLPSNKVKIVPKSKEIEIDRTVSVPKLLKSKKEPKEQTLAIEQAQRFMHNDSKTKSKPSGNKTFVLTISEPTNQFIGGSLGASKEREIMYKQGDMVKVRIKMSQDQPLSAVIKQLNNKIFTLIGTPDIDNDTDMDKSNSNNNSNEIDIDMNNLASNEISTYDLKSETKAETQTKTKAKAKSKPKSKAKSKAKRKTNVKGSKSKSKSKPKAKAKTKTSKKGKATTKSKAKPKTKSSKKDSKATESNTKSKTDTETQTQTETDTKTKTKTDTETQTETLPQVKTVSLATARKRAAEARFESGAGDEDEWCPDGQTPTKRSTDEPFEKIKEFVDAALRVAVQCAIVFNEAYETAQVFDRTPLVSAVLQYWVDNALLNEIEKYQDHDTDGRNVYQINGASPFENLEDLEWDEEHSMDVDWRQRGRGLVRERERQEKLEKERLEKLEKEKLGKDAKNKNNENDNSSKSENNENNETDNKDSTAEHGNDAIEKEK